MSLEVIQCICFKAGLMEHLCTNVSIAISAAGTKQIINVHNLLVFMVVLAYCFRGFFGLPKTWRKNMALWLGTYTYVHNLIILRYLNTTQRHRLFLNSTQWHATILKSTCDTPLRRHATQFLYYLRETTPALPTQKSINAGFRFSPEVILGLLVVFCEALSRNNMLNHELWKAMQILIQWNITLLAA